MIEIEGLPEGFEINSVTINAGETISQCFNTIQATIHLRKIRPRRIVLEETNEERRICFGEWYESQEGKLMRWPYGGKTDGKHKVWCEVKETDILLTNDKSKLSLSVEECRNISTGSNRLCLKIDEFIKENS